MNTRSSASKLRDSSFRFDTGDSRTNRNVKNSGKFSISIDSHIFQVLQAFRKRLIIRIIEQGIIENTCHRDTQEAFLFSVCLPHLPKIREVCHRRLERSQDRCNTYLIAKSIQSIVATNNNARKITELVRTKNNL